MSTIEDVISTSDNRLLSNPPIELWAHEQSFLSIDSPAPENFELSLSSAEPLQNYPFVSLGSGMELTPLSNPMPHLDEPTTFPTSWSPTLDFPTINVATSDRYTLTSPTYLTRVRLSDEFAQRSADLIIEALYAVPDQMLRRETFPPFIHPHWHLPTLPEPLAVCMQLAGMFSSRALEIRRFVWRTILTEQRCALERLDLLSNQEVFAQVQVGIVYLTMRLVAGVMHDQAWTNEMVTIQNAFCSRFLENNDFCFCHSEQTHPSKTWEDWIYAESRRRTSLIWLLITRTIVVVLRTGCHTTDTPETLPLPAPQTQWEARTREGWTKEFGVEGALIATFGGLIKARQHTEEQESKEDLAVWNARVDRLGSLLNIAVALV